ncbi:hypothetical protein [Pseudaestuariivita sp.]|uniref:hypothetical protein n=1 Tax=Pseudaestuariivita sp. TaxID=2211669 RepID=UPI004058BDB1
MAENVTNELLLEHLKRMQDRLNGLENGQKDIMAELRSHKSILGALVSSESIQDGRIAEISVRLDRIEARLDLKEAN